MRHTCYVAAFALQFALSMAFRPTAWTLPKRITWPLHRGFIFWENRERRAWQTIEKGCLGPLYRDQYIRYSRAIAASIDAAVDIGDGGGESGIPEEGRGPWLDKEESNQGGDVKDNERDNYYEVLGLEMGASSAEIKDAYRQLAMKSHPDTDGEGTSREEFEKITAAYEVLSDPGKRSTYDQGLSMKKFVDKVKAANWGKTLRAVANLGVAATSVGVSVGVAAAEPLAKGIEDMAVKGLQSATLPSTMTEVESLRREQQMVQRAKAEAERKLEGLRRRAEEDLAEAAALDEASSARLEEQRQWHATLAERQEKMQKTQQAMLDVECRIAKAGEVLGERKILEQEATEVLRKAKAAREAFLQASSIAQRRVSSAEATAAVAEQRLAEAMKALEDSRNALQSASEQAAEVESQRSKVFGEQDAAQEAVEKAKEMMLSGRAALSECRDKEANVQANLREKAKQERAAAARVKELGDQAEAARTRALRLRANAEDTTAAAAVEAETVESAGRREAHLRAKEAAARAVEEAASAAAQEERLRRECKEAAAAVDAAVARARELEEKEAEAVRATRAAKEAAQRAAENVLAVAAGSDGEENSSGVQSESGDMSMLGQGEGVREGSRSGSPEEQGAVESVVAEGTPSKVQPEGLGRGTTVGEKRQRGSKVPSWVGVMNPRNAE